MRYEGHETREERELGKSVGRGGSRARGQRISCEDCFFRARMLCALELDEPCSTFRPDRPEGLVPPEQPTLLARDPAAEAALGLRAA